VSRHPQYDLEEWLHRHRNDAEPELAEPEPDESDEPDEPSKGSGQGRRGSAGHHLVIADLLIRGFDAYEVCGLDTDVATDVDGTMRRLQVKACEVPESFGRVSHARGNRGGSRTLESYKGKIHGFAFVYLLRRLVFYFHIDAINSKCLTLSDNCWTQRACDMSFDEWLRRLRGKPLP
jgi:hypothetical protein